MEVIMFCKIKKYIYSIFLILAFSSHFTSTVFSAQPEAQELADEEAVSTNPIKAFQSMGKLYDGLYEEDSDSQESKAEIIDEEKKTPLITQALIATLTDDDKNALAKFDHILETTETKDLSNVTHLLLLHYQIIEMYLTEKAAAAEGEDTSDFDISMRLLLIAEDEVYKSLTPLTNASSII
jgi:hypothetical protein